MVQINFAQKTINVKVVYYGPGMSGKTTNLEVVHQRAPDVNRGDLTSISTDGDRTLFFDYMPLDLGTVAGMRTCFQLYTVPGQVYYNSTRKLVLQGVDGVIFIADSSASMQEQNLESYRNLEENLNEYGKSLATIPHVIQYNKRDLPDAMDVAELDKLLNPHGAPTFEGVANTGQGVFPTLKALAASVLKSIMQEAGAKKSGAAMAGSAPATPAAAVPAQAKQSLDVAMPQTVGASQGSVSMSAGAPPAPVHSAPASHAATGPGFEAAPAAPRSSGGPPPGSRPAGRSRTSKAKPSASPRTRKKKTTSREPVSAPPAKGGGLFTSVFITVAAVAGAVIAWFVLNAL